MQREVLPGLKYFLGVQKCDRATGAQGVDQFVDDRRQLCPRTDTLHEPRAESIGTATTSAQQEQRQGSARADQGGEPLGSTSAWDTPQANFRASHPDIVGCDA